MPKWMSYLNKNSPTHLRRYRVHASPFLVTVLVFPRARIKTQVARCR